ncbi:MAG TPA: methyltransferase [Herpetosiphonaceae bacterium]
MQIHQIRRLLFLGFVAQEGVIFLRATPQERKQAPVPAYPALLGLCMLAPLVFRLRLPRWLDRLALALQVLGWALEATAMNQLSRQRSFGIHPTAATKPLQSGLYRFEHPIYLGILVSLLGWTLPVPPSMAAVILIYSAFRRAISQERAHLASLQIRHRGLESWLWPESEA